MELRSELWVTDLEIHLFFTLGTRFLIVYVIYPKLVNALYSIKTLSLVALDLSFEI